MKYLAYHEQATHGTSGFPIQLYSVDHKHPRYDMPFHWHVECELIAVVSGELSLSVEGENSRVKAGECVFVPGGAIHGGTPQNCVYRCLVFDMERFLQSNPQCLDIYKNRLQDGNGIVRMFTRELACTGYILQLVEVMEKQPAGYAFTATGLLWQWLGEVLRNSPQAEAAGKHLHKRNEKVKQVLRRIRNEYSRPLTLEQLAMEAGLNPQYFCRVFRELTGRTPIDYLNYYRIECAAEQLCTSNESITEIALSCGFNDLSYFNRLFKRTKKMSPTAYRKNHVFDESE